MSIRRKKLLILKYDMSEWKTLCKRNISQDKLISAVKVVDAKKWKSTFAKTARTQSASTDTFFFESGFRETPFAIFLSDLFTLVKIGDRYRNRYSLYFVSGYVTSGCKISALYFFKTWRTRFRDYIYRDGDMQRV